MNGFPLPKGQREAIHHEGEKRKTAEFSARALFALVTLKPRLSGTKV